MENFAVGETGRKPLGDFAEYPVSWATVNSACFAEFTAAFLNTRRPHGECVVSHQGC